MAQQHPNISAIGPQSLEALILTEQAAQLLQVSKSFLEQDRTTKRHGIPFVRVGRTVRYRPADLRAWLECHCESGVPA